MQDHPTALAPSQVRQSFAFRHLPVDGQMHTEPTVSRPVIEVGVLGALEVRRHDEIVEIRRGLPRILLSSLVADRGRPVCTAALVDHLWGASLPNHPNNALQTQMAYLRRVLGGAQNSPIMTCPDGYMLGRDDIVVDIETFETRLGRARELASTSGARSISAALDEYERAISLWRGSAYADVAGHEFADAEIVRLHELREAALEERAEVLLALRRTSEAVAELSALVNTAPLRERRQELLVTALYRAGRQADALRAYERARRTLGDELGVDPGPALRRLEQQVLSQDPALDWQPPSSDTWTDQGDSTSPRSCPDDLIGRERELERLIELLAERRLVTLTGPGGAGKTRLAAEVAASSGATRVHVVDLAAIDDVAGVGAHIMSTLGLPLTDDTDFTAAISAALGDGRCLVVLDTCEHVIDGVAPIVERLLALRPEIVILATSRQPLGVADELAWPIPPLRVPTPGGDPRDAAAFELFVRRAREASPEFAVADDEIADVAALCRALDGLPLAIELAAAQMDVLSPRAVVDQLAERRSVGYRSGGPQRHRTLHAVTGWSVDLLDDAGRDMMYRLGVFAPTFDLDAAVSVAGCGDASIDEFVRLVRSSLVAHSHDGRYRLLDTVHAYLSSTEPDPGRREATRRRHAEYYARLAERASAEVRSARQSTWLDRLLEDRANLLLAMRWCFGPGGDRQLGARFAGNIAWVWTIQGNMLDSRAALEEAGSVDADPLVRARVLLGIGLVTLPLGDHQRARAVCTESAALGRSVGDDRTVASALLTLGVAEWAAGDFDDAAGTHERSIELYGALGDRWGATITRILLARTEVVRGDLDRAESLLDASIDEAKQTGDRHAIGLGYEQLARLWLAHGDNDRARSAATSCLEENDALQYPEGVSAALSLLARVRLTDGEPEAARDLQLRSLEIAIGIAHVGGTCDAVESIAEIDAFVGDAESAAFSLLIAERARRNLRLPLSPSDVRKYDDLRARLGEELGDRWGELVSRSPLTSLDERAVELMAGWRSVSPS